jgi:hypothetical protein
MRGSIERGLAVTVSHRDLIFLNAVSGENCDFCSWEDGR